MKIPYKFKIVGFSEIKVIIEEILPDNQFGYYDTSCDEIHLATSVYSDSKKQYVELTDAQIENTFYHELVHVIQFYLGMELDEQQAQSMGNLLNEFINTACYDE